MDDLQRTATQSCIAGGELRACSWGKLLRQKEYVGVADCLAENVNESEALPRSQDSTDSFPRSLGRAQSSYIATVEDPIIISKVTANG